MEKFLFSDAVLRRFLSNLTDYAIIILDVEGHVAAWNEGARALSFFPAEAVMGEHFRCFYTPEARAVGQPEEALAVAASAGRVEEEGWRVRMDQTRFWAHSVITAIYDEHHKLCGYGKVLQDFSARREATEQANSMMQLLEHTARTDYLTGLDNRRSLDRILTATASAARRHGRPFSLAMIDIDYFNAYNEEFGHQAGDAYLREASRAWHQSLRPEDVLARYGGEEFVVVLPDTTQNGAMMCVDRLRGATPAPLTCSAGLAQWDGVEAVAHLLDRADQAVYRAKSAGRNTILFAPMPEVAPEITQARPPWLRVVRRYEDTVCEEGDKATV